MALVLVGLAALGRAETRFIPPRDERPLFQRDLLPLETDTIRALSQHLTTLVQHETSNRSPAHCRADAQLLALALQLDPVNQQARRTQRNLKRDEPPSPASPSELAEAQEAVSRVVVWLTSPAAGSEGRRLGLLIIDPLRVLFPNLEICRLAGPAGEAERWKGSVSPVTAFIREQPEPEAKPAESKPRPMDPEPTPEAESPEPPGPVFGLKSVRLSAPLLVAAKGGRETPQPKLVSLEAQLVESSGETPLVTLPGASGELAESITERLRQVLGRRWSPLPGNQGYTISLGGPSYRSSNQLAATGPLGLALHASLSGTGLRRNVIIMGSLAPDGRLVLPPEGWSCLKRAFPRKHPRGVVIVPAAAETQMRDLLVLEKHRFFTGYEVFSARDLDEALTVAREDSAENVAEASLLFGEFQDVAANKQLGELSSNRHVRARMEKILELVPNHLSARMVLLHGSRQRPDKLHPGTMALELAPCLENFSKALKASDLGGGKAGSILALEESTRTRLRDLERHARLEDRDLLNRFEFTNRRLGRIARLIKASSRSSDYGSLEKTARDHREEVGKLTSESEKLRKSVAALLE